MVSIRQIESVDDQSVLGFLNRFEETTQFLQNNLKNYGPYLTSHHNSGNFKAVFKDENIIAVYCLTRRGNLLVQSSEPLPGDLIISDCQQSDLKIKGFIGDWAAVVPIFETFKIKEPNYKPSFFSKEFLYKLDLKADDSRFVRDPRVRLLVDQDFDQWAVQSDAYLSELNLPSDLSRDQMKMDFSQKNIEKVWWGLFIDGELVSRAALNSKGSQIGQVGGVFTPKPLRKRGYSKATMLHMLRDCIEIHGHKKSILFTGETDIPAQKLYESIGYHQIGDFALILG